MIVDRGFFWEMGDGLNFLQINQPCPAGDGFSGEEGEEGAGGLLVLQHIFVFEGHGLF